MDPFVNLHHSIHIPEYWLQNITLRKFVNAMRTAWILPFALNSPYSNHLYITFPVSVQGQNITCFISCTYHWMEKFFLCLWFENCHRNVSKTKTWVRLLTLNSSLTKKYDKKLYIVMTIMNDYFFLCIFLPTQKMGKILLFPLCSLWIFCKLITVVLQFENIWGIKLTIN